jgi:hypothetical protein
MRSFRTSYICHLLFIELALVPSMPGGRGNRLPNEHNSNVPLAARNRLLQEDNVLAIVDRISEEIKRPLDKLEITAVMSHIRRLDGIKFANMDIEQAVEQVALGYIAYTSTRSDSIIDTHEVMKQYIGGGVTVSPDRFTIKKNAGTVNGMPTDPGSLQHVGGYPNAYAQFPRMDGFGQQAEGISGRAAPLPVMIHQQLSTPPGSLQSQVQSQLQSMKKYDDDTFLLCTREDESGVPVVGTFVKKNNIIKPRQKSMPILLDSRHRIRTTSPNVFAWNISSIPGESPGVVSTQSPMANIIAMKFDEFFIPYVADADNPYKKITLLIEELGMSSVMCHENRHYHMMFDTEIITNRVKLTPENGGYYNFSEPIDQFKRITISFGNPLNQLSFLPDYYPITVSINAPSSTYLTFRVRHYVSDGEIVLISGFTTANPSVDFSSIAAVNSTSGNVVAVIDDYTLEITADISTTTLLADPPSVEAYIVSRRVFIPIIFSYMKGQDENASRA